MSIDREVRITAFNWLTEQVRIHGDVLPREILEKGFLFSITRIPLVSPQGIFKPKILDLPLSITTAPKGPYYDSFNEKGFLLYKYRGNNLSHHDNVSLRNSLKRNVPLIYFYGIVPGEYLAVWTVYLVSDDPCNLTFIIAVNELSYYKNEKEITPEESYARRAYITSIVRTRLHQRSFQERVLDAYRSQCALCRPRHLELLDAAHIIPDTEPNSNPTVNNGIALCKLHHAAFDSFIIGIAPDYTTVIRQDALDEDDGPMLQHGLKGLHHTKIVLPTRQGFWPSQEFLEWRYQKFKKTI